MSNTPELKPCPFCRSKAELVEHEELTGQVEYYVECRVCFSQTCEHLSYQVAIEAWNRRPAEKDWEKRFEEEWAEIENPKYTMVTSTQKKLAIKNFIRTLLGGGS